MKVFDNGDETLVRECECERKRKHNKSILFPLFPFSERDLSVK